MIYVLGKFVTVKLFGVLFNWTQFNKVKEFKYTQKLYL